jgi:hypothetical protein
MMSNYTAVPWHNEEQKMKDNNGKVIAITLGYLTTEIEDLANAERIVACVNYCEGATNQELKHRSYEKAQANLMDAFSLIGQYRAQRDAMVKASLGLIRSIGSEHTKELRAAVDTVKRHDHSTDPMITALLQIVQDSEETPHIQAIAKAALEKGGAL